MEASHHLKKRLHYYFLTFISTIAITPVILGVLQGSLASIKAQDTAGGSLPVGSTFGKAVGISLLHDLPASILIFVVLWALLSWLNSMPMRDFRHKMVMRIPIIGKRALAESMARFTWAMGMISRGGLSAQATYMLALQSVPNLAIRKRLEAEGEQMKESDKLSTALKRTNLLPFEFGAIVETGEVTGDVPRALESIHRATDAEFQAQNATAVMRSSFVMYGVLAVLITIIAACLLTKWYGTLIPTVLGDS